MDEENRPLTYSSIAPHSVKCLFDKTFNNKRFVIAEESRVTQLIFQCLVWKD